MVNAKKAFALVLNFLTVILVTYRNLGKALYPLSVPCTISLDPPRTTKAGASEEALYYKAKVRASGRSREAEWAF